MHLGCMCVACVLVPCVWCRGHDLQDALSTEMAAFKVDLSASIDKVNKSFSEVSLVAVAKRCAAPVCLVWRCVLVPPT